VIIAVLVDNMGRKYPLYWRRPKLKDVIIQDTRPNPMATDHFVVHAKEDGREAFSPDGVIESPIHESSLPVEIHNKSRTTTHDSIGDKKIIEMETDMDMEMDTLRGLEDLKKHNHTKEISIPPDPPI